ncbi:MAG TPA: ribose-5-phosphate isomerase RpiA [Chitinophagaceae bacterium]|nr:ribose-5-phosphate isomerase RpiA [Chitinophagaceae bacterium]
MEEAKKNAGRHAVNLVKSGMTIGIGTGTTVFWFIRELAIRVKEGMKITAVSTSEQTSRLATELGINLSDLNTIEKLQLTIDGADEIDPKGNLIKGGGGALLQEKIVAGASEELVVIADSSKLVRQLGKFPLPIEVIPFGFKQVQRKIINSGFCKKVTLRKKDDEIFVTDHDHYILDCECEKIVDPLVLNTYLHSIPGVVETGLFINMANRAVIGWEDGRVEVIEFK